MSKIFINYRRADTKSEARLLYQTLIKKFPNEDIIMDIDTIPPASDFRAFLYEAVKKSDLLISLIGPRWIEAGDLNDPRDWVRIEIEAALSHGKSIMPIMVNNGTMPGPEALPESLTSFVYINGLPLDTGRDFKFHIDRIVHWIQKITTNAASDSADRRKRILKVLRNYTHSDFSVYPNIPKKRLKGAVKITEKSFDQILGVLDTTLSRNGREGVYFLEEGLVSKEPWHRVFFVRYEQLIDIVPTKHWDHVRYGSFRLYTNVGNESFLRDQLISCVQRILEIFTGLTQ